MLIIPPFASTPYNLPRKLRKQGGAFFAVTGQKTTYPAIVPPPATQAGLHVTYTEPNLLVRGRVGPGKGIAMPGTAHQDASKMFLVAEETIYAPSAGQELTTHNSVTSSRDFLVVKTPFLPDEWERMLNNILPFNMFSDVPTGMRFGFDMGIHTRPSQTYIPPNHNSALSYPNDVSIHINNELSLGRYSGPFSRSRLEYLIGPFRTSPLGTVPKSIDSSERRIVQDLSFPRGTPGQLSVNEQIDIDEFRCDWGTFNDVRAIVLDAPPFTEAATLDVDAAFRCCPITPSQQCNFVVHWNDSFYIDHNAPFGATSSGGIFGRIADAKTAILTQVKIGPSKNWVDDFVFFRLPISSDPTNDFPVFTYSLSDIYSLGDRLGWPWKRSKTRPFNAQFKYLGFVWDLTTKTVQIPSDKKLRYLSKLEPWIHGRKFSRKDAESVLGTLVHCSLAIPDGRSRLPAISRFVTSFNHVSSPFVCKTPGTGVLADIDWWRTHLSADFCGSVIARPPPTSAVEFWVDASSSWGIGVVFNGEWDFWKFRPGWDKDGRNIGWAEFVAIELGLLFAIHHGYSDTHFSVKSDNQGVIHAIRGGKSRSPEQNSVLQRITLLLSQHRLWLSSVYVPSVTNLADLPSRGLPVPDYPRTLSSLKLPPSLHPFILRPISTL